MCRRDVTRGNACETLVRRRSVVTVISSELVSNTDKVLTRGYAAPAAYAKAWHAGTGRYYGQWRGISARRHGSIGVHVVAVDAGEGE